MKFLNEFEVGAAATKHASHPVLGPASATLRNLKDWVNANSDGWSSWAPPLRAAAKLIDLIERDGTAKYYFDEDRADATEAEFKKALTPIKAFRTKHNADFEIVERLAEPIYGYAPHPGEAPRTLIPAYLIAAGARIAVNASSGYDATVTGSRFHDNHLVVDYVTDSGITGTLRFPVVQTGVTLEV